MNEDITPQQRADLLDIMGEAEAKSLEALGAYRAGTMRFKHSPAAELTFAHLTRDKIADRDHDFSEDGLRRQLDAHKQKWFGAAEVTEQSFDALPDEAQIMLGVSCSIAATHGILRHPPLGADESIRCPQCGRVSYNRTDIQTRYCSHCHKFHEDS